MASVACVPLDTSQPAMHTGCRPAVCVPYPLYSVINQFDSNWDRSVRQVPRHHSVLKALYLVKEPS